MIHQQPELNLEQPVSEAKPENPWPARWRSNEEAVRYFRSLSCEQLAAIAHQYTRED